MNEPYYCDMCDTVTAHPLPACPGKPATEAHKTIYVAEGKTAHIRSHIIETPNAAEALEHLLKCWLVFGCREVTLKRLL